MELTFREFVQAELLKKVCFTCGGTNIQEKNIQQKDKNDSDNIKYMDLYGLCSTEIIDIPDILSHSGVYSSFLCLFIPNIYGVYQL